MKYSKLIFAVVFGLILSFSNSAQAEGGGEDTFDAGATAFHHIADANVYSIGPLQLPLPCILYNTENGKLSTFMSSAFHIHGAHGDGYHAVDGYVLNGGTVMQIKNPTQAMLDGHGVKIADESNHHPFSHETKDGVYTDYFMSEGKKYELVSKSTLDGGLFGGGLTSYYDFSPTKNVVSMLIVCALLLWLFISIANMYKRNVGKAPTGKQGFIEPMFVFIQDEVAKPFLGKKWKKFLPFLMTLFFFVLGLNLWGQVPFFGGANVTGNLAVTMVLAIAAFIVTNINGNKHYWEHIFWMPGVPAWVKTILTPVEFLGVFIKPLTLMLRLFANITAGHMVVIIFVGLIFIFGESGANPMAGWGTSIGSTLLTIFMMSIELLVAFIQAFVFTILTASYIGAAIEDHDHDHDEAHAHAH